MASAEVKTEIIEKETIVLTLSREEAETLLALAGRVNGGPDTPARQCNREIRAALFSADVAIVHGLFSGVIMTGAKEEEGKW